MHPFDICRRTTNQRLIRQNHWIGLKGEKLFVSGWRIVEKFVERCYDEERIFVRCCRVDQTGEQRTGWEELVND